MRNHMGKLYEVLTGTMWWRKIRKELETGSGRKRRICYYIIPETDPVVLREAADHMGRMSEQYEICVIHSAEEQAETGDGYGTGNFGEISAGYQIKKVDEKRMQHILAYFRTKRDTLLLLNDPNVYILSFREAGGTELERLYREQIYDGRFLIRHWLLPENALSEAGRENEWAYGRK